MSLDDLPPTDLRIKVLCWIKLLTCGAGTLGVFDFECFFPTSGEAPGVSRATKRDSKDFWVECSSSFFIIFSDVMDVAIA